MIIGQDKNKKAIKHAIDNNLPVLMIGETGTGKTSLVYELGLKEKKTVKRINLNGQTSVDEFVGKWLLKDKQTYWVDGVLTKAMRDGDWIIVDEINGALPEILFSLHSLLDDDRKIILAEKDGEEVKPHKEFRFFATMNPSEEYVGTKDLNKAFMSRFPVVTLFEYPTQEVERKILVDRTGVGVSEAKFIVELATVLRDLKAQDRIVYTCSTRDIINYATLVKPFGHNLAFEYSILNKSGSERSIISAEIAESSCGNLIKRMEENNIKTVDGLWEALERKEKELKEVEAKNQEILVNAVKNNTAADAKLDKARVLEQDLIDRTQSIRDEAVAEFARKFIQQNSKQVSQKKEK